MSVLSTGAEYVAAGSRMVWSGQFGSLFFSSAGAMNLGISDVVSNLGAKLANQYNLHIEKFDNNLSWAGFGGGSITFHLRTDSDRGDGYLDDGLTDILGNVSDEFTKLGYTPTTAVINSYSPAPTDAQPSPNVIHTGAALPTVETQQQQIAATEIGTNWWDSIFGKLEAGTAGFAVGAIAVVGLLVFLAIKSEV